MGFKNCLAKAEYISKIVWITELHFTLEVEFALDLMSMLFLD